jgi:hypothetical protein
MCSKPVVFMAELVAAAPELFTAPQRVLSVDRTGCHGVVLLTETLAVKCVKLGFVMVAQAATPPTVIAPPSTRLPEAIPEYLVFCEETLKPAPITPPYNETPAAAPHPSMTRTLLNRMPTPEEAKGALDGYWVQMPWRWQYDGDMERVPRFDHEISRCQLAASARISPAYHGSCVLMHSGNSLYDRVKFPTGIILSQCTWLHPILRRELSKLHHTSPHKDNPTGVIVMSRCDYTLANMTDKQAMQLAPRAQELQSSLDQLHLCSMQHGILHLDLKASNLGVVGGHLQLLDWNVAASNICLSMLPRAKNQELVLKLIHELTQGIVKDAILSKAPHATFGQQEPHGILSRLLAW